jgi:hypothetical protein
MKYLYKYPQQAYPYVDLINTNRNRGRNEAEYELLDTGIFNDHRYFDVFVEYAKAAPEDILIRITVFNRGPEAVPLHILPTLWLRNTWHDQPCDASTSLRQLSHDKTSGVIEASHKELGSWLLSAEGASELLFTNNETNTERVAHIPNRTPYVKDGINNYIVQGQQNAVNPEKRGTKASAHYAITIEARQSRVINLRMTKSMPAEQGKAKGKTANPFGKEFENLFSTRIKEADEFYATVIPSSVGADEANVMRQALAGMLWTKQFFYYDVRRWLKEHGVDPSRTRQPKIRNAQWHHMNNKDIISMPDKWEYPWYAAWDLAFHVAPLMLVDEDFGKQQLELILSVNYQHPNGQVPAYEWNFGDVNPPVHAWAVINSYLLQVSLHGKGDIEWLERCFHKLLLNFSWWVNRKDRDGSNLFEGGFLGLDNIGVFDRSAPLPTGGHLEQADGTAWMALFSQNMIEIGVQLAKVNPSYIAITEKLIAHMLEISSAMVRPDEDGSMWDEEDGFFYDILCLPDGTTQRLKVRSMVGLLPLCAVTVYDREIQLKYPEVANTISGYLARRSELTSFIHDPGKLGQHGRILTSILNEKNLRRVLSVVLDEKEFLGPYGIRALSRIHKDHPYIFNAGGQEFKVAYVPGESDSGMFGGNSNWRGPVWMPVNAIIVRALINYYMYYGDDFMIECPTGSGHMMNLYQVAEEISRRLAATFLKDESGRRPVFGNSQQFQEDPEWKDYLLFYEYFHGDTGVGLGASHQTGWTGVVARLMHMFAQSSRERVLSHGKEELVRAASENTATGKKTQKVKSTKQ